MVDRYIGIVEAADSISAWSTVFFFMFLQKSGCFVFQNKTKFIELNLILCCLGINKFKIRYGRTRPDALPISS